MDASTGSRGVTATQVPAEAPLLPSTTSKSNSSERRSAHLKSGAWGIVGLAAKNVTSLFVPCSLVGSPEELGTTATREGMVFHPGYRR